jgi:ArsR family transcriptional regulator
MTQSSSLNSNPILHRPLLFKALSDPIRLALLSTLLEQGRALKVSQLTECCGIDFSGVSRHLKILQEAGVLISEKKGRTVEYRLNAKAIADDFRDMADIFDI